MVTRRGRPYDPAWDLWRPVRRWPGILITALVTVGLIVAVAYHFQHRIAQAKPAYSIPVNYNLKGQYYPPVVDPTGVQTFSGTSSRFAIPFTSNGHLSIWTFKCRSCVTNFAVTVRGNLGKLVDIPLNAIGPTRYTTLGSYPAGQYTFDIMADGPWTVSLIDETKLAIVKTPFSYLSAGSSVLGPFSASSNHLVTAYVARLGQLFTVQLLDGNNHSYGYKDFRIRSGSKSTVLTGIPNPYFLDVQGQGLWYVSVK